MTSYFQTIICTEKPIFDLDDNLLKPGKYVFEIINFSDDLGVVKGYVTRFNRSKKNIVSFKYFTVIKLMSKAQSWLLRRTEIECNSKFPNSPSPPSSPHTLDRHFIQPMSLSISCFEKPIKKNTIILDKIEKDECCICLGEKNLNKTLSCKHIFHDSCIKEWMNRGNLTCPMCRKIID
jgi:hypothetical protein|tara:strand:- start:562 stop:1095 length:534 start_codon:yes stop_codon:yes gene_type:complete